MIKLGKLIEFDNNYGTIIDESGQKYIVLKKDILNNDIKVNDIVKFNAETLKTSFEDRNVARFVKKMEKKI